MVHLRGFSILAILSSLGTLGNVCTHFVLSELGRGRGWGGGRLKFGELRPRLLLNNLQCSDRHPTASDAETHPDSQVSTPRQRNPAAVPGVTKRQPVGQRSFLQVTLFALSIVLRRRRRKFSTPVFLPGEAQGQRSLAGYSPRGHREPDEHACNNPLNCMVPRRIVVRSTETLLTKSLLPCSRDLLDPCTHLS